jgi:hypothetical protein
MLLFMLCGTDDLIVLDEGRDSLRGLNEYPDGNSFCFQWVLKNGKSGAL